ncbi:uncharacterized protein LOC122375703 [Amphibalanus amphitrite]|uniref:uncharacterized protein LOC122375703 n=1 Tax=Amphibalanus amphitrite TaxID=1232801 RepID=UPI001C920D14|nr:uncharacterized protein LOC122375703 [Amphibalanus amphitrite]
MASLLPRVKVRNFLEDFSEIDPRKFHFYDFGIQDFLVMRHHITLDEDTDESSSGGDYNQGLAIDPCDYLSDSEVSTGSVDLSAEQVVWEKRLVECPAALLRNRLRHASYKKSNSSHEVRRGRRGGRPLRRRASDNLLCSRSAMATPRTRLVAGTVCWNSDTDIVLPNESVELEIGEDCGSGSSLDSQTLGRAAQHQSNALPPVVTDSERPVQCGAAVQERCLRPQPCLTHALLLAGLPGGARSGRQHLSTAHSARGLLLPDLVPPPERTSGNGAGPKRESGDPPKAEEGVQEGDRDKQKTERDSQKAETDGQKGDSQKNSSRRRSRASASEQRREEAAAAGRGAGRAAEPAAGRSPRRPPTETVSSGSRASSDTDQWPSSRQHSHTSNASLSSLSHSAVLDVVDEPPQMTALERKLIMKKHPMLRNDTNAHILAPPDFRIGMK